MLKERSEDLHFHSFFLLSSSFFCQSAKRETSSSRRSWTCWSLLSDRAVEAICRLRDCRPSILSSTVSLITNRVTETALVWPIRWTLSIACSSTIHQRNFTVGLRCCCCFCFWFGLKNKGMFLTSRIPPQVKQEAVVGSGEVQPHAPGSQGNQQ